MIISNTFLSRHYSRDIDSHLLPEPIKPEAMNIRKYILLLTFLTWLAGVGPATGQEKERYHSRFLLGFTGGATVSSGIYQYANGPEPPSFNPIITPGGGLTFDWRMAKWFSLQNAFLYKGKGDKIDMKLWAEEFYQMLAPVSDPAFSLEAEGIVKTDIRYVEWSLCPTFVIGRVFEIGIGAFAAVGISGKETTDYIINYYWEGELIEANEVKTERPVGFALLVPTTDDPDILSINQLDYGLCGRLGFRIGAFTLAGSVSYSLEKWEPEPSLFNEKPVTQTQNISGMVSLSFFLGKRPL
jgi:hypothetical protein